MKFTQILLLPIFAIIMMTSCRSEFERVRVSADPAAKLAKANEYFEEEDYNKAQMLYEMIIPDFRGKPETEQIFYNYARTHFEMGQYLLASHYYKNFSNTFTASDKREDAEFMAAYANYNLSPKYRLGQENTAKAIDGLQQFVNMYPGSPKVSECNRLIDELREKQETKAFEEAKLYYDLRQYQSALHAFENVLKDYPDTKNVEDIRFLAVKSSRLLADNSIYSKKEERYTDAARLANVYLLRHGKSDRKSQVQNILNHIEKSLSNLKS